MVSKIRLLFLLDPSDAFHGAASEREMNEITVMMDKRWEVHLTSARRTPYENLTCDYEVHEVPLISTASSLLSRMFFLLFSVHRGVGIAKKYDINAIMAKNGHLHLGLAAYLISRITMRKCIVRVNEDDVLSLILFIKKLRTPVLSSKIVLRGVEVIARKIENILFKRFDWIVTHGPTDYKRIRQITRKVTFVPLWVDTRKFKPISKEHASRLKKEFLKVSSDIEVIIFVGRLHLEKDVETLFYSFKKVLEHHHNVILEVIGTGYEEEKCKDLVEQLGITEKVVFLGYIPHNNLPKYYNIADVYVLTSLWEEWSNTVMEAMACGTPVIATNVGGNPYLVKDGETGFLIPPKKPYALAEKIVYILDHPEEVEKITSNARLSIRKFSKQDIGELYKKTIVEVIKDKAPGSSFLVQRKS